MSSGPTPEGAGTDAGGRTRSNALLAVVCLAQFTLIIETGKRAE